MAIITDSSRGDIVKLLNLSESDLELYLKIIHESINIEGNVISEITRRAKEKSLSENPENIFDIYSALYNIARFYANTSHLLAFRDEIEREFDSLKWLQLEKIIDKMKQRDLINELVDVHSKSILEDSILPRLRHFGLTYNYRVLETSKGQNKLIPIIQCEIATEKLGDKSEKLLFQLVPYELDEIIKKLETIKSKYKKYDNQFRIGSEQ